MASAQTRAPRATVEVLLNTDRLAPGQQAIAAIVTTVADGYHAQSSRPLDDSYIPFVAMLAADPALQFGDVLYAPGELQDFPALGGKLSVYHGTVITFVPFVVPADARAGDVTLTASVRLQTCNDQTCDMPKTIKATAKTTIVAAGQKPTSQHGEIFGQFDAMKWLNKQPTTQQAATQPTAVESTGLWTPFSEDALKSARAGGRPVVIDFTAAWCVNCHVVERRVYGDASTVDQLKQRGVTLLRADLTQDGAPGSDLLARLNPSRSIPFTAVYFAGNETPAGLTGIYSSADLLATLDDAGKTKTNTTTIAGYDLAHAPLLMKLLVAIGVGVLLNAVPCVLPVLPLKAMSFYEDAGHDRGRSMLNGGLFSLGIVTTFGGLALFVISQNALWGKFISHPITAVVLSIVLLVAARPGVRTFRVRVAARGDEPRREGERHVAGREFLQWHVDRGAQHALHDRRLRGRHRRRDLGRLGARLADPDVRRRRHGAAVVHAERVPGGDASLPADRAVAGRGEADDGVPARRDRDLLRRPADACRVPRARALVADLRLRRGRVAVPDRPHNPDRAAHAAAGDRRLRSELARCGRADAHVGSNGVDVARLSNA